MPGRFAAATAVEPVGDTGRFTGVVHEGWDIGGNANGGYLMAIAGRAMATIAGRPPLTLTGHFLRPAPAGTCTIDTTVIRSGRRLTTVVATLAMGGEPVMQLLGAFGDQQPGGIGLRARESVELPPYDRCAREQAPTNAPLPALLQHVDVRLHPDDGGFRRGEPSRRPEMRGWFALADREPIDAIGLLLAADALPPPIFNSGLPTAWVPTVELTVHVRGTPAPGPLRCAFRSHHIHDGLLEEDGEIWDSAGTLVCQSRQLALMPR